MNSNYNKQKNNEYFIHFLINMISFLIYFISFTKFFDSFDYNNNIFFENSFLIIGATLASIISSMSTFYTPTPIKKLNKVLLVYCKIYIFLAALCFILYFCKIYIITKYLALFIAGIEGLKYFSLSFLFIFIYQERW